MTTAHQAHPGDLLPRGRVGMIGLILMESALFLTFIVVYLFYLGASKSGPQPAAVLELPVLNTVCLLSSSVTVVIALRALAAGRMAAFGLWLFVTIALGVEFLVGTGLEWKSLIVDDGLTISTNLFGTTFYSLVGFHAFHVTVGLLMLLTVLVLTILGRVGTRHAEPIELVSWYWHFVDVVWIIVLLVVYVLGA